MTTILGVAECALYVADIERAAEFYTTVLGLPITASFAETRFIQTGANSTLILFDVATLEKRESIIPGHGSHGEGHVALSIPSDQYDAWKQRLIKHGVAIEHEQTWSQGTRSVYFRDPDNNSLELIESHHYKMVWDTLNDAVDKSSS